MVPTYFELGSWRNNIASYLIIILQKILDTGREPKHWRSANVTAIFKKGEKYQPSNYWPVSLSSICCRSKNTSLPAISWNILTSTTSWQTANTGSVQEEAETQLLTLSHELVSGLDKSQQHDIIVLDFSKPFDRVPHERLLPKLDHYDVRGSTLEWIGSFLTDRVQQVKVEGATSDSIQVLSGVPQVTALGPLLFFVFINDLPDCVESEIRLFAIDCILYRCIKDTNDCETLQKDLNNLSA